MEFNEKQFAGCIDINSIKDNHYLFVITVRKTTIVLMQCIESLLLLFTSSK